MENTRIVYTNDEGNLSVMIPIDKSGLTLEQIIGLSIPEGTDYHILDGSKLPQDRRFRDAWVLDQGVVKEDLDKAKVIHMDRIRIYRDKKLAELDAEQSKRISMDQDWSDIKTEKQRLRDIPQTLDLSAVTDVEALASTIPEGIDMPVPSQG
jgi:hypothetical protein